MQDNLKLLPIIRVFLLGAAVILSAHAPGGPVYADEVSPDSSTAPHNLPTLSAPTIAIDGNPFQREVFTLKELREGGAPLIRRLIATDMDFPLMFEPNSKLAVEMFPHPNRVRFGKNFSIDIMLRAAAWSRDSLEALKTLKEQLGEQGLDRGRTNREIRIEFLTFMQNHAALREYFEGHPYLDEEARAEIVETLDEIRLACGQVLEFKEATLGGIRTLDRIDAGPQKLTLNNSGDGGKELRFERFVRESKGMREKDIASILEIRNKRQFRELCLERTSDLLADAGDDDVEELLAGIGPSDAIVLAAYFARERIQAYKKPSDQMADLYASEMGASEEELQVGDCRHLAGLTAHYLNLVVKPDNAGLRHWYFGIQRQNVSEFHHACVIAAHVYENEGRESIDLFFIDPVALSSRPLGTLRKEDISSLIDAASRDDHFFSIKRFGEDLVARKHKRKASDTAISGPDAGSEGEGEIVSFDTLLGFR
jgi:hypothetical protein